MHLDARYVTMVENAYYYCNPPPAEKTVKRKRPPLQEYVRKLLYKDLSKVTTEKVSCSGTRHRASLLIVVGTSVSLQQASFFVLLVCAL